jgi:hypothetical protein
MAFREELIHHLIPAASSTSIMLNSGEHIATSLIAGVLLYVGTKLLDALWKKVSSCRSSKD